MYMKQQRPVIKVSRSALSWVSEAVTALTVFFIIFRTATVWPNLPGTIPVHFDASGNIDGWGGRGSVFLIPVLSVVLFGLLSLIAEYPHTFNYPVTITEENAARQYRYARDLIIYMKMEVAICFGYIQDSILRAALNQVQGLGIWFLPLFLVLIFGTVGYYIYSSIKYK